MMKWKASSGLFAPLLLAGCASIVGERNQLVEINSEPTEAEVSITDENGQEVYRGITPTTVTLEKADGYFDGQEYTVVFVKDGFDEQIIVITSDPNGWYLLGNLVFGGLIGWLIVDPATGAMWSLDPDKLDIDLATGATVDRDKEEAPPDETSSQGEASLQIALLSDVPAHAREFLIPLQ